MPNWPRTNGRSSGDSYFLGGFQVFEKNAPSGQLHDSSISLGCGNMPLLGSVKRCKTESGNLPRIKSIRLWIDSAQELTMARPEPGDWIAIRDVGAYTLSIWSRHCSRGIPAVVGYERAGVRLRRNAESTADIAKFWSI